MTAEFAERLGAAYAEYAARETGASPLNLTVGWDKRPSSPYLAAAVVRGLRQAGAHVVRLGICPTRLLSHYVQRQPVLAGGVMITGDDGPPDRNGFKLFLGRKTLGPEAVAKIRAVLERPLESGRVRGTVTDVDVVPYYQRYLLRHRRGKSHETSSKSDIRPFYTKENLPDWFCPVPFAGIIFNPEGNVTSCRELGASHSLGDIRKQSWREIWNGEGFRSLRREFLTGNLKTCAEHVRHRRCHQDGWNRELLKYIDLTEVQTKHPIRLSPDFNGRCNLECEMCLIWKKPNGLYDELSFWEEAERELYPFLKQVDPLSGEPFVQKDTYRLMEFMSKSNPKAVWKITTNAHWKFTPYIREKLDGINLWRLNISVDSLNEENYTRIRKEGDLKIVLKTIDDLIRYRGERRRSRRSAFNITVNILVQRHNWRELGPFLKFAHCKRVIPFIQFLYGPPELSLLSLGTAERKEIIQHYLDTISPDQLKRYCKRAMNPLVESLQRDYGRSGSITA